MHQTTLPAAHTTVDLLRDAQRGDPAAWDAFHARTLPRIRRAARHRLGPGLRRHLDSQDVAQNVAVKMMAALPRFTIQGPRALTAYLRRLVDHAIRDRADYYGATKRRGTVPLTESRAEQMVDPTSVNQRSDLGERLERHLAQLPDDMRNALLLRQKEGLDGRELAAQLGKSEAAARKLYSRALARLHALMTA